MCHISEFPNLIYNLQGASSKCPKCVVKEASICPWKLFFLSQFVERSYFYQFYVVSGLARWINQQVLLSDYFAILIFLCYSWCIFLSHFTYVCILTYWNKVCVVVLSTCVKKHLVADIFFYMRHWKVLVMDLIDIH